MLWLALGLFGWLREPTVSDRLKDWLIQSGDRDGRFDTNMKKLESSVCMELASKLNLQYCKASKIRNIAPMVLFHEQRQYLRQRFVYRFWILRASLRTP